MDLACLESSCKGDTDALVLFDFAAAFPSLGHQYMWAALEAIGIPPHVVSSYKWLYFENNHQIRWKMEFLNVLKSLLGFGRVAPSLHCSSC